MSRCFPFPPPGYERKTKADDTDLLKKERHREKKHKKEKKDKDKKEGKEKREKERSDEKHREKKDKKEKHKDRKKDKEKDRDKDKHKSDLFLSDEKKVVGSADSRVHNNPAEKSKERENDRNATLAEMAHAGRSAGHNGISVSENNNQISETKNFKNASDLGRKSMDGERRTGNHQIPDKHVGAERKKDGGLLKFAAKSGGLLQDSKERTKEKPALDGRLDGRVVIGDARSSGDTMAPNTVVQNKAGGIVKPLEKKIEQKVDGKEKVREKEGDDRKRDKRKEKDRDKSVLKDNNREYEKKKEEMMKAKSEEEHIQVSRMKNGSDNYTLKPSVKDVNMKDLSVPQSDGFHNITKDSNHHAATVNNIKKRKDVGLNGSYDERVTGPNKMARTTASPHPFSENGRSLDACQNSAAVAPATQQSPTDNKLERSLSHDDVQKQPMKIIVNVKGCKMNGTVADPCTESSRETTAKAERKSTAPAKLPHPDIKYLNQVLSVPKMDEWSEFEDQDWLFNSNSSSTRKPELNSSGNDETPQVWAKALWLEPVDVYALPYVIPH